ncbi:MAG: NAD(P)H-dependent oxidoreductase subunit E [bacterium]|nr:NAD(P)H-dependent oxidoreductase subunit E [bacterium]
MKTSERTPTELEQLATLNTMLAKTSREEGGLIPALQTAQNLFGYVPHFAMEQISTSLRIPMATVYGVVTFYHFFSMKPRGKYTVRICLGTACYVLGAQAVLDAFRDQLAVEVGETTPDQLFTLEAGRCFGACGLAPVIMVNDVVHQRVRPEDVAGLIQQYRHAEQHEGELV